MRSKDLTELLTSMQNVLGFFVNVPLASSINPSVELNGTRLTVVAQLTGGIEFSICSSSLVERFSQFETEIDFSFQQLVQSLQKQRASLKNGKSEIGHVELVLEHSLRMFYYWVNFAPLTRGTSATGYAAFLAGVLAMGLDIQNRLPKSVQLDWEALFSTTPDEFISRVTPWVNQFGPSKIPKEWIQPGVGFNNDHAVENVFRSLRHVLYVLQV